LWPREAVQTGTALRGRRSKTSGSSIAFRWFHAVGNHLLTESPILSRGLRLIVIKRVIESVELAAVFRLMRESAAEKRPEATD
jgi:hypothetical protein